MRKALEIGGVVAAAVLIIFGVATMAISAKGRNTVHHELGMQYIVGTPDMTPTNIAPEVTAVKAAQTQIAAKQKSVGATVTTFTPVTAPSCSVAGKTINTGANARCFAEYMRIHALGGSSGLVYSQMGQYQAKADAPLKMTDFNGGTSNALYAVTNTTTNQPVANATRDLWVTETALSTALNTSFMAEQVAMFGLVMGLALLLTGIGFGILAVGGALRNPETAMPFLRKSQKQEPTPVPNA